MSRRFAHVALAILTTGCTSPSIELPRGPAPNPPITTYVERRAQQRPPSPSTQESGFEDVLDYSGRPFECAHLEVGGECHLLCVRLVMTLMPGAARRGVDCLLQKQQRNQVDQNLPACSDTCSRATCTAKAFEGPAERDPDARCDLDILRPSPEEGPDEVMSEICREHTRHMNDAGRDRFIACLLGSRDSGARVCLWDPSVAPCGYPEIEKHDRSVIRIDDDEGSHE